LDGTERRRFADKQTDVAHAQRVRQETAEIKNRLRVQERALLELRQHLCEYNQNKTMHRLMRRGNSVVVPMANTERGGVFTSKRSQKS